MKTLTRDQKMAALALPVLLFGVLGASYAFAADFSELTEEQKTALEQARDLRETGDYEGARELLESADLPERGKGKFEDLTDEQKVVLEEAKILRESGDEEGAKQILEDAGIEHFSGHHGMRGGKGGAIREAVTNNDYDAFVEATQNSPFADLVSEDLFATLKEAHELHEAGDHEGARALMEESGLPLPPHGGERGKGLE